MRREARREVMDELSLQARDALKELIAVAGLRPGALVVVGGSTSEIQGERIGTKTQITIGERVVAGLKEAAENASVALAVQCCEHLNRAIVLTRSELERRGLQEVSARPVPGAGGALAAAYYSELGPSACLAASIKADAGLDIGDTLIGMHLRPVAVPVRLGVREIGRAHVAAARTRPPLIGGARAQYPEGGDLR